MGDEKGGRHTREGDAPAVGRATLRRLGGRRSCGAGVDSTTENRPIGRRYGTVGLRPSGAIFSGESAWAARQEPRPPEISPHPPRDRLAIPEPSDCDRLAAVVFRRVPVGGQHGRATLLRSRRCGSNNRKPFRWEILRHGRFAAHRGDSFPACAYRRLGRSLALPMIASPSRIFVALPNSPCPHSHRNS